MRQALAVTLLLLGSSSVFSQTAPATGTLIELSAQVRNLTNDRYEYVWYDGTQRLHAPADPRSVFGAVRARF